MGSLLVVNHWAYYRHLHARQRELEQLRLGLTDSVAGALSANANKGWRLFAREERVGFRWQHLWNVLVDTCVLSTLVVEKGDNLRIYKLIGMGAKERQSATDSPKVEVGEIDTSAPFQSVKDAVTLFDEGTFSGEKPAIRKAKPHSAERVLAKETQLHLAQKELNKLKDQLKNTETTKAQALIELEKAKRTVEDLTRKLGNVTESKDSAIKETETAKSQAKEIEAAKSGDTSASDGARKQDLESAREQYMTVFTELDAAKQELRKIRQGCDASLEAKLAALNQAAEAEHAVKANVEKVSELSREISSLQESIGQVKLASLQAQQEQAKICREGCSEAVL
ncbi:hypothetical protein GH714_006604 [Hevea brasiliensis]|uniref:Uncharacterized protein n=1 Tax=Hevea brasiliensis TaxID=3981 RepID=A0A6A6LHJ3_HEVBR|nr:hypothetical protein GH714_006604 [Hevea brasiliensis]